MDLSTTVGSVSPRAVMAAREPRRRCRPFDYDPLGAVVVKSMKAEVGGQPAPRASDRSRR